MPQIALTPGRLADWALLAAVPPALLAALLPLFDGVAPLQGWTEIVFVVLLVASLGPFVISGVEAQRYRGLGVKTAAGMFPLLYVVGFRLTIPLATSRRIPWSLDVVAGLAALVAVGLVGWALAAFFDRHPPTPARTGVREPAGR